MLVLGVFLVAVLAAGCWQTNDLQALQKALTTTEEITRGQAMTEFHYQMDFDGLNLTAEERRELEMYRELKGTVTQRFDREKGLCYADGHLDIGGMGFDFRVYADGDRVILLLPTFCTVTGMRRPKRYGVSRAAFVLREHFGCRIDQGLPPQVDVYQVHESGELIATQQVFRAAVAKVAANSGIAELALAEISRDKAVPDREEVIRERAYQNALERWFPVAPVSLQFEDQKGGGTSDVLLTIARFVPQSWAMTALHDLVVRDATLTAVLPSVGVLFLMGALCRGFGLRLITREP
jgi:hypothetical protein